MNNLLLFTKKALGGTALLLVLSGQTQATPIVGEVFYAGNWTSNTGDMATTTIVQRTGPADILSSTSGDYASLYPGTITVFDLVLDPFAAPAVVWTGGGFTFTLDTLNIVVQNSVALVLNGLGTISKAGFDDTMGHWSFSGDTSGASQFAYSTTTHSPVPEPEILSLFGLGLVASGIASRRRQSRRPLINSSAIV